MTTGAGNQERGFGAVRYGGAIGDNIHYRFFAKYFNRDRLVDATGRPAADGWSITRGGYRVDWQASAQDSVTVQGDFYGGNTGGTVTRPISLLPPYESSFEDRVQLGGGNILTRWHRASSARSDTTLQVYFDRTSRYSPIYGENRNTIDIDFQHHLLLGERHEIVWGGGYRYTAGHIGERFGIAFHPPERGDSLFSGFVQDEITVVPDRLHITLGSKIEHNDYTGFEVQPSLRLLWTPEKRQTVWAAVSRAVRMPSWSQSDSEIIFAVFPGPGGLANVITVFGNPASKSEQLIAFEFGYRIQKSHRLWFDAAAYYNIYDYLQTGETGSPFVQTTPPPPHVTIPVRFDNKLNGTAYGLELAAIWQPVRYWRLSGGYTWQSQQLRLDPSSTAVNPFSAAGDSSKNQFSVRSQLNLPRSAEIDVSFYFAGKLIYRETPAYTRSDVRLGWRPAERLELSVVGQNLLRPRHAEFADSLLGDRSTQVRRTVYGKVTWRF